MEEKRKETLEKNKKYMKKMIQLLTTTLNVYFSFIAIVSFSF